MRCDVLNEKETTSAAMCKLTENKMLNTIFFSFVKISKVVSIALLVLSLISSRASAMTYPVSLQQRITFSDIIAEGKVIAQSTFKNSNGQIETRHSLLIYKCFKGAGLDTMVFITSGGIFQGEMLQVCPSLYVELGEQAIFLLRNTPEGIRAVAANQSMIHIQYEKSIAYDRYHHQQYELTNLYDIIEQNTGHKFQELISVKDIKSQAKKNSTITKTHPVTIKALPNITNISPTTITAGTTSLLTITGTGFGTSPGIIEFKSANDGGATYITAPVASITSWTDTKVEVIVPTASGTGSVRLTTGGMSSIAPQLLTVTYNIINNLTPQIGMSDLLNKNGLGGYTFLYNTNFVSNLPALEAFRSAMEKWRCATNVNFSEDFMSGSCSKLNTTTISCAIKDGVNVVSFDNNCSLPLGVLGRASYYSSACGTGVDFRWYIDEIDILFDVTPPGFAWNFGPSLSTPGEIDFESVVLHEMGHAHQLGHVINPGKVMHYNLTPGVNQRNLDPSIDIAGGLYVLTKTAVPNSCGDPDMVPINNAKCNVRCLNRPYFEADKTFIVSGSKVCFKNLSDSLGLVSQWTWDFDDPSSGILNTSGNSAACHVFNNPGLYNIRLRIKNSSGEEQFYRRVYIEVIDIVCDTSTEVCGNLVRNGNFENYSFCPGSGAASKASIQFASPWQAPINTGTCDYYHVCATAASALRPLSSFSGTQAPRSGVAYGGLLITMNEYIQVELRSTLKAGKCYRATAYFSLADKADTALKELQLYFTPYLVQGSKGPQGNKIFGNAQVSGPGTFVTNKTGWTKVSGTFTATGCERYLTVGNFEENPAILSGLGGNLPAYYYIDDICVTECDTVKCPCMPCNLDVNVRTNLASCNKNDGTATVSVVSGSGGPYTYLWDDATTGSANNNLKAGTHSVTITDGGNCSATVDASIQQIDLLPLRVEINSHETCYKKGELWIFVDGSGPFTFELSNGQVINGTGYQNIKNLSAGIYTVKVTDKNGCERSAVKEIKKMKDPPPVNLIKLADVTCNSKGKIRADFIGFSPAVYMYLNGKYKGFISAWDSIAYRDFDNLNAGWNVIKFNFFDDDRCTLIDSVYINSLSGTNLTILSNGDCNSGFQVTADVVGGTSPYVYLWDSQTGFQITPSITLNTPGTYTVTVTDMYACESTSIITISPCNCTNPPKLNLITKTDASCSQFNGTATASVTGGTGTTPFTYSWSSIPAQTGFVATGLSADTYTVTVTDINACTNTASVVIENIKINTTIAKGTANCTECGCKEWLLVNATSGTPPFTYNWNSNGYTKRYQNNLCPGTYMITVTDAAGCNEVVSVSVP